MEGKMKEKLYTAKEVIERIEQGWKNEDELRKLFEFVDGCKMTPEEQEELINSGYSDVVYHAYDML